MSDGTRRVRGKETPRVIDTYPRREIFTGKIKPTGRVRSHVAWRRRGDDNTRQTLHGVRGHTTPIESYPTRVCPLPPPLRYIGDCSLPAPSMAPTSESFNDWGAGEDSTVPSARISTEELLHGIGLHYHLHGGQAWYELNSFHKGVGQMCPRQGMFS